MATANNKRIEETATTALKAALLRCPILESYIGSNDKTPSWDGTVFVYRNGTQKKTDLIGRVPIQVKGTEKRFPFDNASFSCSVADLRNYYNNGGCVFFLVSVNPSSGDSTIYYSSLLVYDLKKLLDEAGKQISLTIKMTTFPIDKINEISTIFMTFVENSRKQASFIGKELYSLEQLEKNGAGIEALTFSTSGIGLNLGNIGDFITSHDFYLYAKPKGVDVEIPIDKISNAIFCRTVTGKVCVKDVEYYASYNVVSEKGQSLLRIGKGISIFLNAKAQKATISFKPVGALSDYILDGKCYIALVENKEITLNGVQLPLRNAGNIDLSKCKKWHQYCEDVKKTFDILGVTEELQIGNLSPKDETNIRNFVNAMLYNKRICFPGADEPLVHGAFKIANLSIWIWATKKDDGNYQLDSFFNPHPIAVFENTDVERSNPIRASQYLLLNGEAFTHASNLNYEKVKADICSMEHHILLLDNTTYLLLNVLRGYDAQKNKDLRLLDLADSICDWLAAYGEQIDSQILKLNKFQIIKRRRALTTLEIIEVGKLIEEADTPNIKCGAYLLLEEIERAQQCFDKLSPEAQEEFMTFPICHFGILKKNGESNDGESV